MAGYYKPCPELDRCNELIERYYMTEQYDKCFQGHLPLAEAGYPLAECQIGYFYMEGLGVEKDMEQAFYWTERAARHGDRDAQFNLAEFFYKPGVVVPRDLHKALAWYHAAAAQGDQEATAMERALTANLDRESP